jgi:hypothetical protein
MEGGHEMISCKCLGKLGQLGNQMFQYAAIRSIAEKQDVPFYCPKWIGDDYFQLNDDHLRVNTCQNLNSWRQPTHEAGYVANFAPQDNLDYHGYFISPNYFINYSSVKKWFTFNPALQKKIEDSIDTSRLNQSTAIHIRLGDYLGNPNYYVPSPLYYRQAISYVNTNDIAVFSDEPKLAKTFPLDTKHTYTFHENNLAIIDLYLLTRCRNVIIAPSTFSWWGAFLNHHTDAKIICPKEGLVRPGSSIKVSHCYPPEWTRLPAKLGIFGSVKGQRIKSKLKNMAEAACKKLFLEDFLHPRK